MKIITSCVVAAITLSAVTSVHAAEADKAVVSRVFNDVVAPAEQVAYEAAGKAYNKCLAAHGYKFTWNAWNHETGDTYKYSYVAGPYTWADFDTMHDVSKACDDTWRKEANPHLKSETSAFLERMADLSHMPKEKDAKPPALLHVTFFKLKRGHEASETFVEDVKKIAAAADRANWAGHFWTEKVRDGDAGLPDFLVVSPSKNWADFGTDPNPPLWKMVEGVYGAKDADALRKSLNEVIVESSSHVDSFNADLTYTAGK